MFAMFFAFSCLHIAGTAITPPYQIFSESSTIYKLISIDSDLTVIVTDDSPVVAIDYHYRRNKIFWVSDNSIRMALLDTTDGVAADFAPFVTGTQITSMSVDWRTSKVYWTDSAAHTIEQYDLESNQRSVLYQISIESSPLGIVVDPFTSWLYWTDGLRGTVERIRSNGTTHRIIRQQKSRISCTNSVSWPIALNYSSQYLYWSDSCVNALERVSVGGALSSTVYAGQSLSFASSITSFASTLWWTQPRTLYEIATDYGTLTQVYMTGALSKLYSVRTVHPDNQPDDLYIPDCSPSCVHGFCADPIANVCDCAGTGWTGPLCNIDVMECNGTSIVCRANQKCINTDGVHLCMDIPNSTALQITSTLVKESLINTALPLAVPRLSSPSSVIRLMPTSGFPSSLVTSPSISRSMSPLKEITSTTSTLKPITVLVSRPISIQTTSAVSTTATQLLKISTSAVDRSSSVRTLISSKSGVTTFTSSLPLLSVSTPTPSVPTPTPYVPKPTVSTLPLSISTPALYLARTSSEVLVSVTTAIHSMAESSSSTSSPPVWMSTDSVKSSTLISSSSSMMASVSGPIIMPFPPTQSTKLVTTSVPAVLESIIYYSRSVLTSEGTSLASSSALASYSLLTSGLVESLTPSKTRLDSYTTPIQQPEWTSKYSAAEASSTVILQLPVIPDNKSHQNVPTYVFVAIIILIVLLLAAVAALAAATLYCRHIRMKYTEQVEAFGDLTPSNKVVNNPLYIGINTLEKIAEQHNQKHRSMRSSSLLRDDVSIAQYSSSGSEASARSDEPIIISAV
eukprot:Em0005g1678a